VRPDRTLQAAQHRSRAGNAGDPPGPCTFTPDLPRSVDSSVALLCRYLVWDGA
jgi:hypothetical protein